MAADQGDDHGPVEIVDRLWATLTGMGSSRTRRALAGAHHLRATQAGAGEATGVSRLITHA